MKEFFVTLAFDFQNADSADYACADKQLASMGLYRKIVADNGNGVELPFNTYAGKFNGSTAAAVRDYVQEQARQALSNCNVNGRLFVAVGGDWAWGSMSITNKSRANPYA